MGSASATRFLNVDLDVRSRGSLAPLVDWMEWRAVVLRSERHRGVYIATFELLGTRHGTPGGCVSRLARLIEQLPRGERRVWDRASERAFDIGIQAGADGQVSKPKLTAATVERIAALGAGIVVTVYPYGWGEGSLPAAARGR